MTATDRSVGIGVGSWIERHARVVPDRIALWTSAGPVTYAELAGRIRRFANGLRDLGVGRGDRVAWLGPNHAAFLESLFAAGTLGAALAPVNHRLPASVRAAVLEDTAPVVVIEHLLAEPSMSPSIRHRVVVGGAGRRAGDIDYDDLIASGSDVPVVARVEANEVLLMPHTSGTTGTPKAVMLSHANVTWNVVDFLTCADFRAGDVTIAIAPFFRAGGTGVNILPVLFVGGSVVIPAGDGPEVILEAIERHRVTVGFGNPDLLDALARSPTWASTDLDSLRFVLTGGAPVPERLIRTFLDRGVPLLQGYGLSEAGPLALLLDAEHALTKVGSAGKPPLLVDTRIVGDDGSPVGVGRIGELQVRGPAVMRGYWGRPMETARAINDEGWLRTGDAARADDDGYIWIVDRLEAGFEVDGALVYPGEIERVLLSDPAIADAGVVGVVVAEGADSGDAARTGDRVVPVALVVPMPGASLVPADLIAICAERLPAVHPLEAIALVDRLPRNAVGKLLRDELAAMARLRFPGAATG